MQNSCQPINTSTSAYIHIPFCEHLCYYCNFNKFFLEGQPVADYLEALLLEMELRSSAQPQPELATCYIGGGTPTSLSAAQLEVLLKGVRERFRFTADYEFTVEANPGDLTQEKLQVMKDYGVNRLSMGVQTFDDRLLKKIGRKHTAADVYDTLKLIEKNAFSNVSIDLIYALPGQTLESFRDTLQQALALDLPHYALYSLILENKTMFMNWVRQGRLQLPDQELEAQMFAEAIARMNARGREQYEISNFARPGYESRHNLVYWNNETYFGFGAGASGYIGSVRYRNFGPIQHYLQPLRKRQLPLLETEQISSKNQMEEEMFLGLRKKSGISQTRFKEKFGVEFSAVYGTVVAELAAKKLLLVTGDKVALTEKGLYIGNDIFEKFLLD